jgi:hypothetical protein
MFDQRKDPPERVFSQCARVDSNHHGLVVHKALNPNHPAWIRFLPSEARRMAGLLHALDALDRVDVATSVATGSPARVASLVAIATESPSS